MNAFSIGKVSTKKHTRDRDFESIYHIILSVLKQIGEGSNMRTQENKIRGFRTDCEYFI